VGVHALDDRTLEFKLQTAAPYWIFPLVLVSQSGARLGRTNGPWHLRELETTRVVIERDPGHPRRGNGNIARVEWIHHPREDSFAALLRAEADAVNIVIPSPVVTDAVAQGKLVAEVGAPLMTSYVCFTAVPPFVPDLPMRRAMAHAIDRRALRESLNINQEPAQGGLVPPGLFGHTPNTVLPFDPDLARDYLQKSDHRGTFRLTVPKGAPLPSLAGVLQSWHEVLRLDIEVIELEFKELDSQRTIAHAGVGLWVAGYPDPEYFLRQLLHSRSPRNVGAFFSSDFDDLVDRATIQETSAARLALFHEADRMAVQQDCSVIPLYYTRPTVLLQPWVHGWWFWGAPWFSFDELTIDERSPRYRGAATKSTDG
jgi:ABC-type oligopeptide transport system substrate-binding subunit